MLAMLRVPNPGPLPHVKMVRAPVISSCNQVEFNIPPDRIPTAMAPTAHQWTIGADQWGAHPIDLPEEACAQLSWYYYNSFDVSHAFTAPNGHAYYIDFTDGLLHSCGAPSTKLVFLDGQPLKPGLYQPAQVDLTGPSARDEMPPPEDKGDGEVSSLRSCALA